VRLALVIYSELRAEQGNCNGIMEDARLIEHLVHRPSMSHPKRSAAGAPSLHELSLEHHGICSEPDSMDSMTWIGWALLSALFAAATALLAKVGVAHVDSNLATAIRTTVVLVFAWAIALALGKHGELRMLDRRTVMFLALSGMATGLSWLCYFRALQLGPASRVAPLDKLSVPLVMLFAWLLLGEKLTIPTITGGVLITAGAIVMVLG
jgi:bacterial/archaeal transporter family protein